MYFQNKTNLTRHGIYTTFLVLTCSETALSPFSDILDFRNFGKSDNLT